MEVWKDIKGYEGLYQVSNWGRVKRVGKYILAQGYVHGYLKVVLSKDNKCKNFRVHRLVADAFIPNPDNLPYINHINEFKDDNRVCNLEWCDAMYNSNYGSSKNKIADKLSKKVSQFTIDGDFIKEWSSAAECGRNGYCKQSVNDCCQGKRKTHKGYIWRYA